MAKVEIPLDKSKYNVFLEVAGADRDLGSVVKKSLTDLGMKVMAFKEDYHPGEPYLQNLMKRTTESQRMVVILTPNSIKNPRVMYESYQGIKKMLEQDRRFLIVLRDGITRKQVPPMLRWVTDIDYQDPWKQVPWQEKIKHAITVIKPLDIILQGNDIGFGMAWGYFYSYLNIIVPPQGPAGKMLDLKGRIEKHLATRENQDITYMPRKIYILVPESGILPSNIANVDDRITLRDKDKDKLKTEVIRGGTPRPYMNMIRTIEDGGKKYQCLVEYATVLQPLKEMEDNKDLTEFQAIDREVQIKVFYQTLKNIISNTFTKEQQAMVEVVHLRDGTTDEPVPLHKELLDRIKNDQLDGDIETSTSSEQPMNIEEDQTVMDEAVVTVPPLENGQLYHVYLAYAEKDEKEAYEVKAMLLEAGFSVMLSKDDFTPGMPMLLESGKKMKESRRLMLLVTENFLKQKESMYDAQRGISKMIEMSERYVIVLRKGKDKRELPKFLTWGNDIDYANPNRDELLRYALTDKSPPLRIDLLGNDVGFGMAWGYFYSYLNVIVPPQGPTGEMLNLKGRIEKHLATRENQDITYMPRKIYILVPESGILPSNIANVDDRITLRDKDKDKLKTEVIRGGTPRPYMNMIRTIED
ncbi:unnamed protein product, partial [Owenia fusiformis]